jgi:hypothetical protein
MKETIPTATYCYAHPTRETALRCKRCERYICASCAQRTPTGYLCKDCVRAQQKIFDTAEWYDYALGFITAGFLSAVASFLVSLIGGFGIFGWLLIAVGAPSAAAVIAEGVRSVTRRHRSRLLFITIGAGVAIGALPIALFQLLSFNIFGVLFQVVYLVIAIPIIYTRLSGIQLFK